MNKSKYARIFMKMARYDCMILTVLKTAKTVLTVAVIVNTLILGAYIASSLKK